MRTATSRSVTVAGVDDRCELCGARSAGSFPAYVAHLRKSHPGYARGLFLRVVAPFVFVLAMGALAAVHAPALASAPVLVACLGLLGAGVVMSRQERAKAGARPSPPIGQLLRQGGFRFLLIPVVLGLLLVLGRH